MKNSFIIAIIAFSLYFHITGNREENREARITINRSNVIDDASAIIIGVEGLQYNKQRLIKIVDRLLSREIETHEGSIRKEYQYSALASLIYSIRGGEVCFDMSNLSEELNKKRLNQKKIMKEWLDFNVLNQKINCRVVGRRAEELMLFFGGNHKSDKRRTKMIYVIANNLEQGVKEECFEWK